MQCKGKNDNYGTALTINELDSESKNAQDFEPKIKSFIMATTSPRDADIQERARVICENRERDFPVSVWSWDDISDELQCRPDVYKEVYNEELPEGHMTQIKVSNLMSKDRIMAFFTRKDMLESMSASFLLSLRCLVEELMDNSFRHGEASEVCLSYNKDVFTYEDNGKEYNQFELPEANHGGYLTLKDFKEICGKDVEYSYEYKDSRNILTFAFKNNIQSSEVNEVEMVLPRNPEDFLSRFEASRQVIDDVEIIRCRTRKTRILFLQSVSFSGTSEYIRKIVKDVPHKIAYISFPGIFCLDGLDDVLQSSGIKYGRRE